MPFVDFPDVISGGNTSHSLVWITSTNCCMISMFLQIEEFKLEDLIYFVSISTQGVQKLLIWLVLWIGMLLINIEERLKNYLDLAIDLQTLWNTIIKIVPLVFGALGTIHESTIQSFQFLHLHDVSVCQLVKTVLLKTATILRRHFGLSSSS